MNCKNRSTISTLNIQEKSWSRSDGKRTSEQMGGRGNMAWEKKTRLQLKKEKAMIFCKIWISCIGGLAKLLVKQYKHLESVLPPLLLKNTLFMFRGHDNSTTHKHQLLTIPSTYLPAAPEEPRRVDNDG